MTPAEQSQAKQEDFEKFVTSHPEVQGLTLKEQKSAYELYLEQVNEVWDEFNE